MSHRILKLRATHLRPPSTITASDTGEVTLTRADYAVVATNVPYWRAAGSASLRRAEFGLVTQSDFASFVDRAHDVRVSDVFEVGDDLDQVQSLGNVGPYLRVFGTSRIILAD